MIMEIHMISPSCNQEGNTPATAAVAKMMGEYVAT